MCVCNVCEFIIIITLTPVKSTLNLYDKFVITTQPPALLGTCGTLSVPLPTEVSSVYPSDQLPYLSATDPKNYKTIVMRVVRHSEGFACKLSSTRSKRNYTCTTHLCINRLQIGKPPFLSRRNLTDRVDFYANRTLFQAENITQLETCSLRPISCSADDLKGQQTQLPFLSFEPRSCDPSLCAVNTKKNMPKRNVSSGLMLSLPQINIQVFCDEV